MATDPSESSGYASEVVSLKRRFPEDSPRSMKWNKNKKTKTGECICTIRQTPFWMLQKLVKVKILYFVRVNVQLGYIVGVLAYPN